MYRSHGELLWINSPAEPSDNLKCKPRGRLSQNLGWRNKQVFCSVVAHPEHEFLLRTAYPGSGVTGWGPLLLGKAGARKLTDSISGAELGAGVKCTVSTWGWGGMSKHCIWAGSKEHKAKHKGRAKPRRKGRMGRCDRSDVGRESIYEVP